MKLEPQGEHVRKAIRYISDERKFEPGKSVKSLLQEACLKFDLSPLEADFIMRLITQETT